jgi:hypothetical protein
VPVSGDLALLDRIIDKSELMIARSKVSPPSILFFKVAVALKSTSLLMLVLTKQYFIIA